MEGATCWAIVERSTGQARTAGMAGVITGLDMATLLHQSDDLGIDTDIAAELFAQIEAGMVAGVGEVMAAQTASDNAGETGAETEV